MTARRRPGLAACIAAFLIPLTLGLAKAEPDAPPSPTNVNIDLSESFHTRSPWRFVATQDPPVWEPLYPALTGIPKEFTGSWITGVVHLCLKVGPDASCLPDLVAMPQPPAPYSELEPHYLSRVDVVYPRGQAAPPLLLLRTASLPSGDGNQAVYTQLLAYNRTRDMFGQAYAHATGHNRNEEIRFIDSGPLQGSVISVEPTDDSPFAYWVTVNMLTPTLVYKPVLHYRSATRYNDGNRLPVSDSEMPNIQHRLGIWRSGSPLPVPTSPAYPCDRPRLSQMELWCQ